MALVTETGVGLATAESLATVAEFKTYSDNYGFSYAAFTDTQIEQFLRQSTRYLGQKFRLRWKGVRTTTVQALDWPRAGVIPELNTTKYARGYYGMYVVDPNTIPDDIKHANIIMAQKAATDGDLFVDSAQRIKSEKIGPIETVYDEYSAPQTQYESVASLLTPYLGSSGGVGVNLVKG